MDGRLVERAVLSPQGLHAGLHNSARIHGEDKAGIRPPRREVVGLSVDPVDQHQRWADDIKEMQGAATSGDPAKRTPADNQTVRNVFVVGPDRKIKLILVYPMTTGRKFDEVFA
jgi:alkyl hydroperoxide reductase subunit AhpC